MSIESISARDKMCLYIFPNLLQGEMYLPTHNNLFHFYFDNFLQIAHNADAASCLHLQIDVSVYGQYFQTLSSPQPNHMRIRVCRISNWLRRYKLSKLKRIGKGKGRWWWQYILIESNLCKLYSFGAKNYFLVFPSKLMVSSAENVNVIPQNYVLF